MLQCLSLEKRLMLMLNDAVRCTMEIWPWGEAKSLWDEWFEGEQTNVWRFLRSTPPSSALEDQGKMITTREGETREVIEEVPVIAKEEAETVAETEEVLAQAVET